MKGARLILTDPAMDIFYKQAHENLRKIEREIMHAKSLLDLFREYRNDLTRQNLVETINTLTNSPRLKPGDSGIINKR